MLDALSADIRFAARLLWKSPGFTAVAVATLALGIGANTAIFSVVDYVLLRPLPYSHAERLYAVHEVMPRFAHIAPLMPVNVMHFTDWRRNARAFEHMAIISGIPLNLTGAGEPQQLNAARVSPSLFWMLGVQAQLGRTFLAEEDTPGRDRVVVLEDALWRTRFGADPGIVGRRLVLDGNPVRSRGRPAGQLHVPEDQPPVRDERGRSAPTGVEAVRRNPGRAEARHRRLQLRLHRLPEAGRELRSGRERAERASSEPDVARARAGRALRTAGAAAGTDHRPIARGASAAVRRRRCWSCSSPA